MRPRSLVMLALFTAGCAEAPVVPDPPSPPGIRFTDVTAESGLDTTWISGHVPITQILEAKGGGLALIDFEGDGDLDVFVPNGATMDDPEGGPGATLWENLGDMRFRDATADAGIDLRRWGIGVCAGDYDGDGYEDLYVTGFGRNTLLRNRGDGTFADVTDTAGVGGDAWSAAGAFGDLDGDGDLDLYVANYLQFDIANPPPISSFKGAPVFKGPRGLPPAADVLYENLGDGTFRDVAASSGCAAVAPAFGLGCVILDFDADGRPDIYVGNDSTPNFLFRNLGDMRFEDVAARGGLASNIDGSEQSTMGIAIGDVSGNGLPDVFTTNFSNDTNTLHVNKDGRFFDDETRGYGVGMLSFPYVGWAAGFYDLDLDGDEDLLMFNGHVYPNATVEAMDAEYLQPPLLYERDGDGFDRVTGEDAGAWLADPHCDRGAAFGDLDGDGDVDVVVVELNGPVRVLRNDAAGNWLIVEPDPPTLGVMVEMTAGDLVQRRWVYSGGSFASASDRAAYFGVPAGHEKVGLRIHWPDGRVDTQADIEVNQRLRVMRP